MYVCCVSDGNINIFTTTQRDGPYKKKLFILFSVILTVNSDYFLNRRLRPVFVTKAVCVLCGVGTEFL